MALDDPPCPPALVAVDGPLWVIDKPAGYVVHPVGNPDHPDILAWAVAEHGAPACLAPIHRLDRLTSGVVLCSPDAALRGELGAAFAERRIAKIYLALVHDIPARPEGVVDRPLAAGRRAAPRAARTHYRIVETFDRFALLEVRPETGRKHQIRRHLNAIGHGLVGDRRYRHRRPRPAPAAPGRLWLHARSVTLPDGRRFVAPLAPELEAHLARLRRRPALTRVG